MLSETVRRGKRAYCWNTKPRFRLCAGMFVTSAPEISTLPVDGSSNPAMIFRIVVLPEPLGPSSVTRAPSATENEVGSTAVTIPNSLDTWSTTTAPADPRSQPTIHNLLARLPRQFRPTAILQDRAGAALGQAAVCFLQGSRERRR